RLHELIKVGRAGSLPVPHILSFRSEHGRNYAKVFRQLLLELSRLKRDHRRQTVVYIITHGQCHIAPDLVAAMAQQAYLYGIIILPSSEVTLEFLPLLHRHQIVEPTALSSRAGRRERALDIVGDTSTAMPAVRFADAVEGLPVARDGFASIESTASQAEGLVAQGRLAEAERYHRELIAQTHVIDYDYDDWLRRLADIYRQLGRRREAGYIYLYLHYFDQARDCFPGPEGAAERARVLEVEKRWGDAAELYAA